MKAALLLVIFVCMASVLAQSDDGDEIIKEFVAFARTMYSSAEWNQLLGCLCGGGSAKAQRAESSESVESNFGSNWSSFLKYICGGGGR